MTSESAPFAVARGRARSSRTARTGARLLAAAAIATVTPLAIVDSLWLGPWMIGAAAGHDRLWLLGGVGTFLVGALPVLALAVAAAVPAGGRRPRLLGAILALVFAALSLTSLHAFSPLSWVPGGRWIALALALAAAATLLRAAGGGPPARAGRARRAPLVVALLLVLVALVPLGLLAAVRDDGLPSAPSGALAADLIAGSRLTGAPLVGAPPGDDAGLLAGQGSNIHGDAAMSDAYFGRHVTDPRTAHVRSFRALGDCASVLFDRTGRLVAVCASATRLVAYVLDPETLERLAQRRIGARKLTADFTTNFAGGGYAILDRAGRLVLGTAQGVVERFGLGSADAPAITPVDRFDVHPTLARGEPITSTLPDASDRLWYVGAKGSVGVLDPRTGRARALRFPAADIENSFALAPGGGAYVVTSRQLVRLRIDADGAPRVVWEQAYDNGDRRKPGQTSRASGTTPTVMLGGRYVAITDNAEPRMHVQVYDARPRPRGRRLVCQVPVFAAGHGATENSLIAVGGALFVENNYGYRLFSAVAGHSSEPGVARVDFDPAARTCRQAWVNDEVRIPSVVSKVAAADGTLLTYTKPPHPSGIDAWYFTALDATTGEVLWQRRAGAGVLANNHYAALYLGPGGNLYVGTIGGVIGLVGERADKTPRR